MGKGVIWDLDGVLVDTAEPHFLSWMETLPKHGLDFSRERFRKTFGMNNTGVVRDLLGREPSREMMQEIIREKEGIFRDAIRGQVEPLPGVREWLERLQTSGFRQAIASSAPLENIDAIVDELALRRYFDAIVSAAEMPSKPDPAVFLEAARQIDVPPERCIVVEDSLPGVEGARRAGMKSLAVATTHPAEALQKADLVAVRLNELPVDAFDKLLEG
jgi:beta-phosphoglucomutase family hydrolase